MTSFGSRFLVASLVLSLAATITMAATGNKGARKTTAPEAVQTNDDYRAFLINNIFNYYGNNGAGGGSTSPTRGSPLFEFPKGSLKTSVYAEGVVWGGRHKGRTIPKVGGSSFRNGLQAGRILLPGGATESEKPVADDPTKPEYHIYRVRPDITPKLPFATVQTLIDTGEVRYISRFQSSVTAEQIYTQYITDWNSWPAAFGAPFQDVDSNGIYDPAVDVPGVPGADQTLWYVANDLDSARVFQHTGSPPIGLEMQRTIWGYRRSGEFGNMIFERTLLINKSGAPIDSMYIAQWSDTDLGEANDDLVGCDTVLTLGYFYNGRDNDFTYGITPPAVGYMLLQGPEVPGSATDTAWVDNRPVPGHQNLGMTVFHMTTDNFVSMRDARSGLFGDVEWWRLLRGRPVVRDSLLVDPHTGRPTPILFPGDPVTGEGWIETDTFRPDDYRLLISSGPFTMANGDTQSILIAHLIAQGRSRLASVTALKEASRHLRTLYEKHHTINILEAMAKLSFLNPQQATVAVIVDARFQASAIVTTDLSTLNGTRVADVSLFDDGTHGDQHAGDRILAGWVTIPPQRDALFLNATVSHPDGSVDRLERLVSNITTALPLEVYLQRIFADNINSDFQANPWEQIRFGVTTRNATSFDLTNVAVRMNGKTHSIASLPSGAVDTMRYNASDPGSYFEYQILGSDGTNAHMPVLADDPTGNVWNGTVLIPVTPLHFTPQRGDTLIHHVSGISDIGFGLSILDPAQFKGHLYAIKGVDSINAAGDPGFTLIDSTEGHVLLRNYPLPDRNGYVAPVTDGFKVLGVSDPPWPWGTMRDWDIPAGSRRWTWVNGNGFGMEGLSGAIGNARENWFSGGVPENRTHSVLIRFAATDTSGRLVNPTDTLASFAYRYLRNADQPAFYTQFTPFIVHPSAGYAYQDYTRSLPFAAYDVAVTPRRRLMVGFLENNASGGLVDGRYWPPSQYASISNTDQSGPREFFFIFDVPYSETPDPSLQVDILSTATPMMWVGTPTRRFGDHFYAGDEFFIKAFARPTSEDLWVFQLRRSSYLPLTYALLQNFPNPFNPGTKIRYRLPEPSRVVVKVYDLLGREVRTLVDNTTYAGEFTVLWDGTDNRSQRVASGVYFYRIQAEGVQTKAVFGEVKKMLLLR